MVTNGGLESFGSRPKKRMMAMKDHRDWEKKQNEKVKLERRKQRKKEYREELDRDTRELVYARYGTTCYLCGKKGAKTIDHIIPIIKGGTHDIKNLRPTHKICNKKKGNKIWILPEELESIGW